MLQNAATFKLQLPCSYISSNKYAARLAACYAARKMKHMLLQYSAAPKVLHECSIFCSKEAASQLAALKVLLILKTKRPLFFFQYLTNFYCSSTH
jgi:hypothetical protein